MNKHAPETDPIGEALAIAQRYYLPDLCCSARLIAELLHAMAKAGNHLVEADDAIAAEAFFQAYLQNVTAYEDVMRHPGFAGFKAEVEGAWFGDCRPNPMMTRMDREDMTPALSQIMLSWRHANGKSNSQMLTNLALQKVALAAASATAGEEEGFIEDDYRATKDHMIEALDWNDVDQLEARYFRGNGTLFIKPEREGMTPGQQPA